MIGNISDTTHIFDTVLKSSFHKRVKVFVSFDLSVGDVIRIDKDSEFFTMDDECFYDYTLEGKSDYYGLYIVTDTKNCGGGYGMGIHDVFPDGWKVICKGLDNGKELFFYQSGNFSAMMDHERILPIGEHERIMELVKPLFGKDTLLKDRRGDTIFAGDIVSDDGQFNYSKHDYRVVLLEIDGELRPFMIRGTGAPVELTYDNFHPSRISIKRRFKGEWA